jgi:hypothetical protein
MLQENGAWSLFHRHAATQKFSDRETDRETAELHHPFSAARRLHGRSLQARSSRVDDE